ncbi:hypothetical protein ACFYMW_39130 [Streptomyces sp. NPDC006692]|uniref:hypothetical protein n=1 Tax=Streptomyces sp. NPDC006692 TaxID=3364758 RepID=UPI0036AB54AA
MKRHGKRHLPLPMPRDARTVTPDGRCVDCGAAGTEEVALLPRIDGEVRRVLACPTHAAARRN